MEVMIDFRVLGPFMDDSEPRENSAYMFRFQLRK
jgi:hypothetical protein